MNRTLGLALMISGFLAAGAWAADWPQYRGDASRSAASAEELPEKLQLQWTRQLPAPRPAFSAEVRLQFDACYEPVVLGKTLFLPSMVTDSVTALDTETGRPRWQFFTEGPVRFAPVAWQENVYFVSDDGYLYCVAAADGQLRWKFQAIPQGKPDRKLLGSGRLISLWPARGGPVLHEGILYFGAGLWSTYGVGVYAIDAATGRPVWANTDSNHIARGNMDHGIANYVGLSLQGYLAVVNGMLVVPCGAQLPAFLDLKTGTLKTYSMGWGGRNGLPKGTWFVAGTRHYLSHGGDLYDVARNADERLESPTGMPFKNMLYPGGFTRLRVNPTNQKDLGPFGKPVFTSDVMYDRADKAIVAYDLTGPRLVERSQSEVPASRRTDTYPDKWTGTFRELWKLPSARTVHIQAGAHLYVADKGVVEAIRLPPEGQQPRVVWQAAVEGTPHRMLAADGKLFVVTREGRLLAFAGHQTASPTVHTEPHAASPAADSWTKTAAEILRTTKVAEGYAVVLGVGTGRLVEELVRQSRLNVIAVDRDAQKADELRRRLYRSGLYGTRVSVHVGDPLSYPLPPYLANLVVSENWAALGDCTGSALVEAVFHPLRPYGGTACLALSPARQDEVRGLSQFASPGKGTVALRNAGAVLRQAGPWLLLSRDGPLPGAADWSHAEADAGNTGASAEQFLQAPLDLLWFDGPPRWVRTPGATLVRVSGGRVLIKAETLQAVDVFTGRRLWEARLPFPHSPSDQFIALRDAIYVTGGATCVVLDPATGRQLRRIALPEGLTDDWSNLRACEGYLVGQSDKHLLCFDRSSGRLLWNHACQRAKLRVAVGGGKVFCAELADKRRGESDRDARTQALELTTGKPLWEIAGAAAELRYCPDHDLLLVGDAVRHARDGSLLTALHDPPRPDEKAKQKTNPQPLFVVGRKLLYGTAENLVIFDLLTGERLGEPLKWVRRGCTVPRASAHFVVTRSLGNAACIDLATRQIIPFWNVRTACSNSLFPADGVLNMPSLTGGCTCNYLPVSQAYVPSAVIPRVASGSAGE